MGVRVLLVGGNDDFLDGLSVWLQERTSHRVIAQTRSARAAIGIVAELAPDLVLMDATLPDMSGFEASRSMKSLHGAPLLVLMSLHVGDAVRAAARAAGADGCVSKTQITRELLPLVERLLRKPAITDVTNRTRVFEKEKEKKS